VTHKYLIAGNTNNMFRADVTIENQACNEINNIVYRRVADWDIDPTPFSEFVTIRGALEDGVRGNLHEHSTNNGFCSPDPSVPCDPIRHRPNLDFEDLGPRDHGMQVQLDLGSLSPSSKVEFSTWYGVAKSECDAFDAVTRVGAQFFSFGQSAEDGTPATFIYAVKDRVVKTTVSTECKGKLARAPELAVVSAVNESEAIAERQRRNSAEA
jgi:hypothetical protein